jgi:host factor-I protein
MSNNVEQEFYKTIMSSDMQITAFLKNGIKLIGKIVKHDENCFLLQRDQHTQLVYKDAVSTIFPKAIETPVKQS